MSLADMSVPLSPDFLKIVVNGRILAPPQKPGACEWGGNGSASSPGSTRILFESILQLPYQIVNRSRSESCVTPRRPGVAGSRSDPMFTDLPKREWIGASNEQFSFFSLTL